MKQLEYLDHTMSMEIKSEDINFIEKYFPSLYFSSIGEDIFLTGILYFIAKYDDGKNKYYIYNNLKDFSDKHIIKDSYEIEIKLSGGVNPYREVREVGGKILKVAALKGKKPADLHAYTDGKVCVMGYLDEDHSISLKDFIGSIIIPFFYDQSYYAKHKKWPRGEFSHSYLGLLENYYVKIQKLPINNQELVYEVTNQCIDSLKYIKNLNGNQLKWEKFVYFLKKRKLFRKKKGSKKGRCFCGSREYFPICHQEAFKGFVMLQKNIKEFNLQNLIYKDNS